jgi:hypothetical protein
MAEYIERPSYKTVVTDKQEVVAVGGKELVFSAYEDLKIQTNVSDKRKSVPYAKRQFLIDLFVPFTEVTSYVNTYHGFHGVGDQLSTDKVLDVIDKCVSVELTSDSERDLGSEDDN